MEKLKKERKQIVFVNLLFLWSLLLALLTNPFTIKNLSSFVLLGFIQIMAIIAYFNNKKDIKHLKELEDKIKNKMKDKMKDKNE